MAQPKRDIIAEAINAGGATKESLMKVAKVNSAGLSSQFTYLRLTGKFPIKQEDGTFAFVDADKWEEMKASAGTRKATAPKKSLAERLEAATKRQVKLQDAYVKKEEAFTKDASEMNRLRLAKADAEVGIVNLELDELNAEEVAD